MGKLYERGDDAATEKLLAKALKLWHEPLLKEEVGIAVVFVQPELDREGRPKVPAIMKSGNPVTAQVSLLHDRYRIICQLDVLIEIDGWKWKHMEDAQRLAVLDHELEHVQIKPQTKQLYLVPDDWSLTGFVIVAKRHQQDAAEVIALAKLRHHAQMVFDFVEACEASDKPAQRRVG